MPVFNLVKAKGLYSFPNYLSEVPPGALKKALNVFINREGIIEPSRGFKIYGSAMGISSSQIAKQGFIYKNRILRHYDTTLQFDSDGAGTFTSFSGTYASPSTNRIKSTEANGNFFFTTSAGVKKISAESASTLSSSVVRQAGAPKALYLDGRVNYDNTGFFSQNSVCSYKVLWGYTDENQNLLLGSPSNNLTIYNPVSELLLRDYNNLLAQLDGEAVAGGVANKNYLANRKLPNNSSINDVRTAITSLRTALDDDIVVTSGGPTVTSSSKTAVLISITFSAAMTNYIKVGDYVKLTNYVTGTFATELNNNTYVVASLTAGDTVVNLTAVGLTIAGPVADAATVNRRNYSSAMITAPAAASDDPTTAQITAIQDYYDAVVTMLQSEPSGVVTAANFYANNSTQTTTSYLKFPIPSVVIANSSNTTFFYQVYRTELAEASGSTDTLATTTVGGEYKLAYEGNPTSTELSNGYCFYEDIIPSSFLGAYLYTNENSGEGALNANEAPPLAKDITLFKDTVWYANTQTLYRKTLNLLSISNFRASGEIITISAHATTPTITTGYYSDATHTVATAHGLSTGDYVVFTGTNSNASIDGRYQVTVTSTTQFTITGVDTTAGVGSLGSWYKDLGAKLSVSNSTTYRQYEFITPFAEITKIATVADVANSLDGDYFYINSAENEKSYYVWFSTGAGGVDPAISGKTGIKVVISTGELVNDVAIKLARKLTEYDDFKVFGLSTNNLYIQNSRVGYTTNAVDVNTTFTITTATEHQGRGNTVTASGSITSISIAASAVVTSVDHNLTTGDYITISGTNSTPMLNGVHQVTVISSSTFSIPVTTTVGGSAGTWVRNFHQIAMSNLATPSQQIDETSRNLIKVVAQDTSSITNTYYLSGVTDIPGILNFEAKTLGDSKFYLLMNAVSSSNLTGFGIEFSPDLSPSGYISSVDTATDRFNTATAHGLVAGDSILITGTELVPSENGVKTILTTPTSTTFTVADVTTATLGTGAFKKVSLAVDSDNEVALNRLYYAKTSQPEAVPLLNYINIGPKDEAILRILPLRDGLFILKENTIYRLTGGSGSFTVNPFDNSTALRAPDSAVVLNNLIYMFSDQGIAQISDTGVQIISRQIEDQLLKLNILPNFETITYGTSYESDRSYYLWTIKKAADTTSTRCFRFNTFTASWTELSRGATFGIVNPTDDLMYIGATDTNYIEVERKSYDRTDYANREYTLSVVAGGVSGTTVTLSPATQVEADDVIVQNQYVTISRFNQLLNMLDADNGVADSNYYSLLAASAGNIIRDKLTALAAKLDADTGITTNTFAATIAAYTSSGPDTQLAFNAITNLLNNDATVITDTYVTLSGTTAFEALVESVTTSTQKVVTTYAYPWVSGDITLYKHYDSEIEWSPIDAGQPGIMKHFRDGTIIFENNTFTEGLIGYATDLLPEFQEVTFLGYGSGAFGNYPFGSMGTFGGMANSAPMRTLIPREKMRCRYISARFKHTIARELFSVYGITYTFETLGERAYR